MPYAPVIEQDKAESGKARPQWESVNHAMERLEVPGGWLYRNGINAHYGMVFVPKPRS